MDEGHYFRANGHEYGRWPEEGHDAVTGTSRSASATHLYCLDAQHDPWREAAFAWRTCRDDNGLLSTLRYARSGEAHLAQVWVSPDLGDAARYKMCCNKPEAWSAEWAA